MYNSYKRKTKFELIPLLAIKRIQNHYSKIYNTLKLENVFNYRLLVFYYNLNHNNVLYYLTTFLPNTSITRARYPTRNPSLQPPIFSHEYISKTCKYRLPVLLNSKKITILKILLQVLKTLYS